MMPATDDYDVDKLLAEGRLGGPVRERILDRVLRGVDGAGAAAPSRGARWTRMVAALLAAGSIVGAVVLFTRSSARAPDSDGLRAKGLDAEPSLSISLLCSDGEGVCQRGERLFFRVGPTKRQQWLVAYAERTDQPGAPRIWLSPGAAAADDTTAIEIPRTDAPSILRRAVELDPRIEPGRYKVTMFSLEHAPAPGELRAPPVGRAPSTAPLVIR
jgi:hypothetical protein